MPGLPPPDFAVAGGARTSRSNPTTPRGREVSSLGGREAEHRRPSDEAVASHRRQPSSGDQPTTASSGNPPAGVAGAAGAATPEVVDEPDEDEGSMTLLKGTARLSRGKTHHDLPTGLLSQKGKSHRRNHSSGSSAGFSATILKEAREKIGSIIHQVGDAVGVDTTRLSLADSPQSSLGSAPTSGDHPGIDGVDSVASDSMSHLPKKEYMLHAAAKALSVSDLAKAAAGAHGGAHGGTSPSGSGSGSPRASIRESIESSFKPKGDVRDRKSVV